MLRFNIPDQSYVLSLDDLDFNLLKKHLLTPTDKRLPLWSAPPEDSALYQVRIAPEAAKEEVVIQPYKSYPCYICNVDVPEKFYKQHIDSKRHQTHNKLAGAFLANVTEQIDIDIDTSDKHKNDEFYCEICCTVVSIKRKRKHKKSSYHLKSTKNVKLTSKFLAMYINNKSPKSDGETRNDNKSEVGSERTSVLDTRVFDNDTHDTEIVRAHNLFKIKDSKFTSECDNVTQEIAHVSINNDVESTQSAYNIFAQSDQQHQATSKSNDNVSSLSYKKNTVLTDFQMYLDNIIEKYNLPRNIPILEDNLVVVVTPKGYREYISMDNFHGYSRKNNFVYCLLCQMWVQNDIKWHEQSQKHATHLMRPINDKFARILDDHYSHCLLCNAKVITASNHTAVSSKHRNYPEESSASNTYHEEPTNSTVNPITKKQKIIAYKKQFSQVNERILKCLVCSVSVFPVETIIIQHVEGIRHKKKCNILLRKNKMQLLSFDLYYCEVCKGRIHDFIKHMNMHEEEKYFSLMANGDKYIFKKYVYEDPLNDDPIAKKHRQKYAQCLKRNKIVPSDESKFYCNVCFLEFDQINGIDHMFEERHRLNISLDRS